MYMIYRSEEASQHLRDTWETADIPLRVALSRAVQRLNKQLSRDPQEQGESRDGQTRILLDAPVGVLFEVDQERKLVCILRSWAYVPVHDRDAQAE